MKWHKNVTQIIKQIEWNKQNKLKLIIRLDLPHKVESKLLNCLNRLENSFQKQKIIWIFYLFVLNSVKTCKNCSKMYKNPNAHYCTVFDIIVHYLTSKTVFVFIKENVEFFKIFFIQWFARANNVAIEM